MNELTLTGLDGSNPLGFLAALGVLNVLDDATGGSQGRLLWREEGYWRPVLVTALAKEQLLDALVKDLTGWKKEPVLQLAYGDGERDLKPPPEQFRAFLETLLKKATPQHRRSAWPECRPAAAPIR